MTFRVELTRSARQALEKDLPEAAAVACWEFIRGPLAENQHRVGTALRNELQGRYSARRGDLRVIYEINDDRVVVRVINIRHRRDAYHRYSNPALKHGRVPTSAPAAVAATLSESMRSVPTETVRSSPEACGMID